MQILRHLITIASTSFILLALSLAVAYFIFPAATPLRQESYDQQRKMDRPIDLYARVVDERKQPVPGALVTVAIERSNWRFRFGAMERITKDILTLESDADGNVSVTGQNGLRLTVTSVVKPGWQWIVGGDGDPPAYAYVFTPMYGNCYVSDKSRPAELLLWRKGASGEPVLSPGGSEKLPDGTVRPNGRIRFANPKSI